MLFTDWSYIGIANPYGHGVDVATTASDGTLSYCHIVCSGDYGFYVTGTAGKGRWSLSYCTSTGAGNAGIYATHFSTLSYCTVVGTYGASNISLAYGVISIDNCIATNSAAYGIAILGYYTDRITNCSTTGNVSGGYNLYGDITLMDNCSATSNTSYGIVLAVGANLKCVNRHASSGQTYTVGAVAGGTQTAAFKDSNTSDTAPLSISNSSTRITFERFGGSATDHRIYDTTSQISGGAVSTILSDTSTKPAAVSFSWKFSPKEARTSWQPLRVKIATLRCVADQDTTATFACQRDNTGLTMTLRAIGQYPGITSDVTTNVNPAADSAFHDYSITVHPTANCVIDIYGEAYGGTTYNGWFAGPVVVS
jgi:hypothetical protein